MVTIKQRTETPIRDLVHLWVFYQVSFVLAFIEIESFQCSMPFIKFKIIWLVELHYMTVVDLKLNSARDNKQF